MDIWMDDPDSKWEIQELSGEKCEEGKLGWVLRLGKKILVTGIVISSAPLVLPPLMAVSAIGFICSVPYGIFLMSYACTETVMRRLLPMPSPAPPLLLEYGKTFNGEEEANGDENQGAQNEVIIGGISIENETPVEAENVKAKQELMRETGQNAENADAPRKAKKKKRKKKGKRKQSIKESVNEQRGDEIHGCFTMVESDKKERDNVNKQAAAELKNVAVHVENNELKRNEGTTKVKEEKYIGEGSMSEKSMEEFSNIVLEFEGDEKNGSTIEKETPFQIKKVDVQLSHSTDIEEDEELVRETRGLLEKLSDEGKTDHAVDDKWITGKEHESAEKVDQKNAADVEKAKTRCIFAHDRTEKPTREFETKVEENKADIKLEMKESVEIFSKDAEGLSEEMDVDNIHRRAQPVGPVSETVNDGTSTKELTVESAILVGVGKAADNNENNVDQDYLLKKDKKDVIFSNEDEEQGLDLLEDFSTVSQQGSPSDVNTSEESRPSSYLVCQEISDSSELPVSTKAQESDDIRISGANAIDTVSNEAVYSEKIWEQIDALRTIVGYKAARQETCIEELKAIYLFTGIEPPASLKDMSDLAEIQAKLRYLKSVVGVM